MRPPNDFERTIKDASIDTNEARDKRILKMMQDAYDRSDRLQATGQAGSLWRVPRLAVAAAILLAAGALLGHLTEFGRGSVAWADVAARFQTVPFFNATMYIKEDGATGEPMQMELWWSRNGRVRIRIDTQVVFARNGAVTDAFDITTRGEVEANEWARMILGKLSQADTFSLDAVIQVMFGGAFEDVTPLVNPDAVIAQDMVVFDVDLPHTPEWVRIWALRESRLPVRIRVWDPRDGACTDAVFEYSREQQPRFFDPDAFRTLLQSHEAVGRTNIAYAFLQDPGGKAVTPEEMFEKSGYHMPVVNRAGMTEDGAFWVLADKALNQRASGSVFYGFARIGDDLGRTYIKAVRGYHGNDNKSLDVFVPIDYPFDQRRPQRITLVCSPRQTLVGNMPDEIIGTVELTQWEPNAPCPKLYEGLDADALRLKMTLARHLVAREHAERLTHLLETIPNWSTEPTNTGVLLFWQEMTYRRRDFRETVKIGQTLAPLLLEAPSRTSRYHFTEYIGALAATGRPDEAEQLFQSINAIEDMSPEKSDERYYQTYLRMLVERLIRDIGLTVEQVSEILGFDISSNDALRRTAEQGLRDAAAQGTNEIARRRLKEIAAHYRNRPLPEKAELLPRPDDKPIYFRTTDNRVPGHEDYRVLPVNYAISGVVSNLRAIGANASEASRVHPRAAAIRFADGLQDRELRADLVYADGIELAERFHLVLSACGLELTTETLPPQTVFVARYNGHELGSYKEIYGPWHADDGNSGIRTWHAPSLLEALAEQMQPSAFVLDETGLDRALCLGDGSPHWEGPEGIEQARHWLREQFGITLMQETREVTTYLIQRRTP